MGNDRVRISKFTTLHAVIANYYGRFEFLGGLLLKILRDRVVHGTGGLCLTLLTCTFDMQTAYCFYHVCGTRQVPKLNRRRVCI